MRNLCRKGRRDRQDGVVNGTESVSIRLAFRTGSSVGDGRGNARDPKVAERQRDEIFCSRLSTDRPWGQQRWELPVPARRRGRDRGFVLAHVSDLSPLFTSEKPAPPESPTISRFLAALGYGVGGAGLFRGWIVKRGSLPDARAGRVEGRGYGLRSRRVCPVGKGFGGKTVG